MATGPIGIGDLMVRLAIFAAITSPFGTAAIRHRHATSYAHRIKRFSEAHSRLTIYNRRTGRIIWRRIVSFVSQAVWSPDGQAFALVDDNPGNRESALRLMVWRAGEKVRIYRAMQPIPYLDAIGYLAWSPDDRRLLMLTARGQGNASVGYWDLWCLNMHRGHAVEMTAYPDRPVTEAHWIGRRRIRFWTVSWRERNGTMETVVDKAPHEWTCP